MMVNRHKNEQNQQNERNEVNFFHVNVLRSFWSS